MVINGLINSIIDDTINDTINNLFIWIIQGMGKKAWSEARKIIGTIMTL